MMFNYGHFNHIKGYVEIPFNMCPTSFYTLCFESWEIRHIYIVYSEKPDTKSEFHEVLSLAGDLFKQIVKKYKKSHALSKPFINYLPHEKKLQIKIGMLEKERLKESEKV